LIYRALKYSPPVTPGNIDHSATFHTAHQKAYGHSAPDESVQVVNLRLRAVHKLEKPEPKRMESVRNSENELHSTAQRSLWLGGEWQECEIYKREELAPEHHLGGPLIVQEREATLLVELGWELSVDQWGNILLEYV
jgi:N-methylhydantoinase A/oxoprolinase/acetone carboxylase beta subunit